MLKEYQGAKKKQPVSEDINKYFPTDQQKPGLRKKSQQARGKKHASGSRQKRGAGKQGIYTKSEHAKREERVVIG